MVASPTSTLLADAEWLAHRYDPQHDAFHYRFVPRARHATMPFLTDEGLGAGPPPLIVARNDAVQAVATPAPLNFIFHSAYCASTMLVRALDVPGSAMGLSEPVLLNDLVGWRRRGAEPTRHAAVLRDALAQLARAYAPGEAVVVKPSNVFNGLAASALALVPAARAVLLYAPLPDFLLSVARKGLWCRLWTRELLEGMLQAGMVDLGFESRDYFRQSDLQVAAVGWIAQQALFDRLARTLGPTRIATLDSRRLGDDPAAAAAGVARHFQLPATDQASYAAHPALTRNSKSGEPFAAGQRQRHQDAARHAYGMEIDQVAQWAKVVAEGAGVPLDLPLRLA